MDEIKLRGLMNRTPVPGMPLTDTEAMKCAIIEAYRGATRVSPNPLVGCVVLDAYGKLLSQGYHEYFGGPHAEAHAIQGLTDDQLRGARVFVTLEPCSHHGKTPPCAQMLAQKPIAEVIYGLIDPNPLVSGRGAAILREAGIKTTIFPELKEELEELCEAFLWNFRQQKIFVTLKLASSLDGVVALQNGESQWITNEESRHYAHYLRATHDAIMVGAGTIRQDNPRLNIRHPDFKKINRVVILDTDAEMLPKYHDLAVSKVHNPEQVIWAVADDAEIKELAQGPQLLKIKRGLRNLNIHALFDGLWQAGIRSVFVEGGSKVASSLIEAGLVNRLYLFQAPIILGQKDAFSWTAHLKTNSMDSRIKLKNVKYLQLQTDILTTGLFS